MAIVVPSSASRTSLFTQINSTTYVDLLGLEVGLSRLPGELSANFLKRIAVAGNTRRDHSYQSTLQRVALELGLSTSVGIRVSSQIPVIVSVNIAGLSISSGGTLILNSPLLNTARDNVWEWRKLSDIVKDINASTWTAAVLTVPDAPALQLARQTNYLWAQEDITIRNQTLQHTNIQSSTILFNKSVPSYAIKDNRLLFASDLPANTTIRYAYIASPFDVVISDVAMIGLLDPGFASTAAPGGSVLAHQISEVLQDIMQRDRSYWAA